MFATNDRVPEQFKHLETLFGSQVKQLDASVQAVHFEGFKISGVKPNWQGHFFVAPLKVIVLSQVKQIDTLLGSQVMQFEFILHRVQNDKFAMS